MKHYPKRLHSFSLVEVVIALGVLSVVTIGIMGLVVTGLRTNKSSGEKIQAAHLASLLVSMRESCPTNDAVFATTLPNFAIPSTALTNAYAALYPSNHPAYVALDGQTTNATGAVYQMVCSAGTNEMTGPNTAQLYLMLSWPPEAAAPTDHYEIITEIPLR